jgi:hypothetical protein
MPFIDAGEKSELPAVLELIGVLRLRNAIRDANRIASLRMTI